MKFGGTSVASAEGWQTIAATCRSVLSEGHRVMVVCSALAGISNQLEALLAEACKGSDVDEGVDAIHEAHVALAGDIGVALPASVVEGIEDLRESLKGVQLLREASPKVRARVMAMGELMSTRLGAAWLAKRGLHAAWTDARRLLHAVEEPQAPEGRRYLSAKVVPEPDPGARRWLPDAPVLVTQGFIASDDAGETVLLGRGGSDTSAAYLAVVMDAARVEIWTDVPGLFTANPRRVADARHLEELGYDEVAMMASLGARVLHPRCVEPVCEAEIPLHVRSTYMPDEPGTVIGPSSVADGVKAVTSRKGLALLRMCRPSQWQPVGFVADVSACFKQHGLSIDLMSTSPSTIAVTVDPSAAPGTSLDALVRDLQEVCEVDKVQPVASVSLVGTGVRRAFDRLGEAFQRIQDVPVEMVSQGAADHHITFVVDEPVADDLVLKLHQILAEAEAGPTWRRLVGKLSA